MTSSPRGIYEPSPSEPRIRQGEVLSAVLARHLVAPEFKDLDETTFDYAVVVTQECDLTQHYSFEAIAADKNLPYDKRNDAAAKMLSHVLLVPAQDAGGAIINFASNPKSTEALRIRENRTQRHHFLAAALPAEDAAKTGFGALVLDFRDLFSVRIDALISDILAMRTARRSILTPQYSAHLSVRAASFLMRVPLATDHHRF